MSRHPSTHARATQHHVHLTLDGVSHSFADRRVLTDITLTVSAGERVGLIGENGSGKTTLLGIAAGEVIPDVGSARVSSAQTTAPGRSPVALLRQNPPFAPTDTVAEAIGSAVAHVRAAAQEVDASAQRLSDDPHNPTLGDDYAHALEAAELLEVWTLDSRIHSAIDGLGLGRIEPERLTGELSGGQRARLSLAWVLLHAPEVLLLDEPTNHLDDAATGYLLGVLKAWGGPILFASHDRAFLDEAVTSIVDLDPSPVPLAVAEAARDGSDDDGAGHGLTRYTGTYSDYLAARAAERERWERRHRDEQAELRRLRASVRDSQQVGHPDRPPPSEARITKKFYSDRNATVVARRVNDARSRLGALEERQIAPPPRELEFAGLPRDDTAAHGDSEAAEGPVVRLEKATVEGRLSETSVNLGGRDRLLVTGPNGAGKSTLLRLIARGLEPSSGAVTLRRGTSVGLLGQDVHLPDPHGRGPQRTVIEAYTDAVGRERAERTPLSAFGLLATREEQRPVVALSTGQQRRLELAVLLADPPDLLLLDEPTNHLSLALVTAIERQLPRYPGAVVVASHDRWLRDRWRGRRLELG